jgi:hypothetical protein
MTSCFWGFKNPKTWGFHQQRRWIYRRFFCNKWNKWTHGDFTCKVGKSSQMFTVKSLEHQAFLEVQLPTPMAGMLWWPQWVLLPWKSWNEKVVNSIWRNDFPIFNSLRYWADTRFSLPPFFPYFPKNSAKFHWSTYLPTRPTQVCVDNGNCFVCSGPIPGRWRPQISDRQCFPIFWSTVQQTKHTLCRHYVDM